MLEIDQWQPIEIKLNIKCRNKFELANKIRGNKIPCTIKKYKPIKQGLHKVTISVQACNLKKFMKKIKKLTKD